MICITVTPVSRQLAKVDLLNAARHGDIVELCLDHLAKKPDVHDLISAVTKPVIVSCRRREDGGHWTGTEDARLLLLRQSIAAGPAYIELDLATAPKVPRYGAVKRVISFTCLDGPVTDIPRIFDEAARHDADVVKYTWPTPTLDDAWPLMAAVTQKRTLPIVGMGMGKAEITFSLLGQKYGSPWIYAALEHGMEAHDGQATVFELNETYDFRSIDRQTRFVAVAGLSETACCATQIVNAAFRRMGKNIRCLPIAIGNVRRLENMLDALHISGVLVIGAACQQLLPMATHVDTIDSQGQYVDLLLKRKDGWHGYNTIGRSSLKLLEAAFGPHPSGRQPFAGKSILVLGNTAMTQFMAQSVMHKAGIASVCGSDDRESQQIAKRTGCRHVPFQGAYDILADAVIIADPSLACGQSHRCLNPSLLKPGMTVLDVSNPPQSHELLSEARDRGCRVIEPQMLFAEHLADRFFALSGEELPSDVMETCLSRNLLPMAHV
jgi:3-dehydroquinate dehydratase/shikimate dehydrogenase